MTQQELKEYIIARIYPNNAQEITGASLQEVLLAIVANSQNEEEATEALAQLATEIGEIEDAVAQNTSDIATKQETLTLTVKDNGNIVIGNLDGQIKEFMPATPSGSPLHNWFTSIGAIWNGVGYWQLLGVDNLTNSDMLTIAKLGNNRLFASAVLSDYSTETRIVTGKKNGLFNSASKALVVTNMMANNPNVEVVQFSTYDIEGYNYPVYISTMNYAFYNCHKLRNIRNILDISLISAVSSAFSNCKALTTVFIKGVKTSLSFADSPLSEESATYLLQNADSTAQFTVTFRADRQALYEANADFMTALNEKPNITILYQ